MSSDLNLENESETIKSASHPPTSPSRSRPVNVTIRILDKEYQVMCPPDEKAPLLEAAEFLDQKMKNIRAGGKVFGLERIAVMAALNLSYELLHDSKKESAREQLILADQLDSLIDKVQTTIDQIKRRINTK